MRTTYRYLETSVVRHVTLQMRGPADETELFSDFLVAGVKKLTESEGEFQFLRINKRMTFSKINEP